MANSDDTDGQAGLVALIREELADDAAEAEKKRKRSPRRRVDPVAFRLTGPGGRGEASLTPLQMDYIKNALITYASGLASGAVAGTHSDQVRAAMLGTARGTRDLIMALIAASA